MALAAGQSLSFYEILAPADDEERLRRFEREAKTLASLCSTRSGSPTVSVGSDTLAERFLSVHRRLNGAVV